MGDVNGCIAQEHFFVKVNVQDVQFSKYQYGSGQLSERFMQWKRAAANDSISLPEYYYDLIYR